MSYEQNILLAYSGLNLLLNMKDLDMDRFWDMYIYCKTNGIRTENRKKKKVHVNVVSVSSY